MGEFLGQLTGQLGPPAENRFHELVLCNLQLPPRLIQREPPAEFGE
ncbi:MAG TPA: hypothetical protein VF142_17560 [Longimicrobium sp.]